MKHLRQEGKKQHVVNGLVSSVEYYEQYLEEKRNTSIQKSTKEDTLAFINDHSKNKSALKQNLRSISLYYNFASHTEMVRVAGEFREKEIAKTRKIFKLGDFLGVNREHIKRLAEIGIVNVKQIIQKGKTRKEREELSKETGIPLECITEYVKLSDLSRLEAIKSIRARLYYDAGIDTIDKMANLRPEELREKVIAFIAKTGLKGIAPLPKEAQSAIEKAKSIERIVIY